MELDCIDSHPRFKLYPYILPCIYYFKNVTCLSVYSKIIKERITLAALCYIYYANKI